MGVTWVIRGFLGGVLIALASVSMQRTEWPWNFVLVIGLIAVTAVAWALGRRISIRDRQGK